MFIKFFNFFFNIYKKNFKMFDTYSFRHTELIFFC